MASIEVYRESTIGTCLIETLDDMVSGGFLSPEHAFQVLIQFDKSMSEALKSKVKRKISIKGHLFVYNFRDDVWRFTVRNAHIKSEDGLETVASIKIVTGDSTK